VETCQQVPPKLEEWRQFFVSQQQKRKLDRQSPYGSRFEDVVRDLPWQEALQRVQEPWQLHVVTEIHGMRPEFSSDGGVYTILHETVPNMLRSHECSDVRRQQLFDMVDAYVEPATELWSFRGD
jgi:hypothetical protein